jgi:hypothetical protein
MAAFSLRSIIININGHLAAVEAFNTTQMLPECG